MIITKTFKCGSYSIELRLYVGSIPADKVARQTHEVAAEVMSALGIEAAVSHSQLIICSNRAGLHYAYVHSCFSENRTWDDIRAAMETTQGKLIKAGWKEAKGN